MRGAWQVVVEHRIEKTGGGAYRLKSADGRVDRKVTKRVVEELNLHYNVQADNPCSLLTQEGAKKFLHNGNEEDRYRFFLGAANLGTQKQDLMSSQARGTDPAQLTLARPTPRPIPRPRPPALPTLPPPNPPRPPPDHPTTRPHQRSPRPTQVNIQAMEEKTEKAQQRIPEFEEYARAAKEEYDGAVQLKELELMKEQMEPMVAWAQVAAKEREHAQLELDASTADEGVGQVQEKSDTLEAELAQLEEQLVRISGSAPAAAPPALLLGFCRWSFCRAHWPLAAASAHAEARSLATDRRSRRKPPSTILASCSVSRTG